MWSRATAYKCSSMSPFVRQKGFSSRKRLFPNRFSTTTTRIAFHTWQSTTAPLMVSERMALQAIPSPVGGEGGLQRQQRTFASRRRNTPNKKDSPLANEKLIKVLMKQNSGATPDDLMVRLVINEGPQDPSTVEIMSLADAIRVSVDRVTDLIGISLDSDPPVIKATDLAKLEFMKDQQKTTKGPKKQQKSFRFRAGIDLNDLDRKVKDIKKFLEKGMDCEYSVFSKARMMRQNEMAGMELVDRIQELLKDHGVTKRPPQKNERGNMIRVLLEPKRN